jgi:hypothetical protein
MWQCDGLIGASHILPSRRGEGRQKTQRGKTTYICASSQWLAARKNQKKVRTSHVPRALLLVVFVLIPQIFFPGFAAFLSKGEQKKPPKKLGMFYVDSSLLLTKKTPAGGGGNPKPFCSLFPGFVAGHFVTTWEVPAPP